jgi:probable selenium-dependent hydroxylase accessory protein YqeC
MRADPTPDLTTPSLCAALALAAPGELVSIVGGGGKSALLFALARSLPGHAVITTTTRIFANQTARAAAFCRIGTPEFEAAMNSPREGLLVIGEVEGEKARGVAAEVPATLLAAAGVDFVVVEADGSRMRPAKAPAPHEPVVPEETTLLVVVAGIDALAGPIAQTCHRPGRVAALLGLSEEACLDPARLAELLCHPEAGLKGAPDGARIALLINKIEDPAEWRAGRALAAVARRSPRIERVVLGALEPNRQVAPGADTGFEVWLSGTSSSLAQAVGT